MAQWAPLVPDAVLFVLIFGAVVVGIHAERWRARSNRRMWTARKSLRSGGSGNAPHPITDATEQLRTVMDARFEKRRLLSKSEARIFFAVERAIRDAKRPWRAMAQVCLGEILSSPDTRAYSAINSKRVDILVISNSGEPIAAIEYQGEGHYQGSAPARDAVKKEALRRAGVRYLEFTPEHGPADIAREITRLPTTPIN